MYRRQSQLAQTPEVAYGTLPAASPPTAAATAPAEENSTLASSAAHHEGLGGCNAPMTATMGREARAADQPRPASGAFQGVPPQAVTPASGTSAGRRLARLRRFTAYCSALLGRELLPAEQAEIASRETLAAALTERLGAAALGDLSVRAALPAAAAGLFRHSSQLLPHVQPCNRRAAPAGCPLHSGLLRLAEALPPSAAWLPTAGWQGRVAAPGRPAVLCVRRPGQRAERGGRLFPAPPAGPAWQPGSAGTPKLPAAARCR